MSAEAGRRVRGRTRAARALALVLCLLTVLGLAACAPADRGWADRPQAIAGGERRACTTRTGSGSRPR